MRIRPAPDGCVGRVLNEQTADHPFVVSSVPCCRLPPWLRHRESGEGSAVCRAASDGGGTARRPGTGLRQLGCDAVRTGCAGGPSASLSRSSVSLPSQDRRDGVGIALPASAGSQTIERITFAAPRKACPLSAGWSLAQENSGGPECYCVPWELEISYQLKNGKNLHPHLQRHAADEDIRAALEAIPDAADAIAAAADTRWPHCPSRERRISKGGSCPLSWTGPLHTGSDIHRDAAYTGKPGHSGLYPEGLLRDPGIQASAIGRR